MYVYISESEKFKEFDNQNSLYWTLKNVEYGDWEFGENKDGLVTFKNQIELTDVINVYFAKFLIIFNKFNAFNIL